MFCCAVRNKSNVIAFPTGQGKFALVDCLFDTVHGLYQDIYAFRDSMTYVVLQNLTNANQSARISCKDYVMKLAVYKNRLAIQVPKKILVEDILEDEQDGHLINRHRQSIPFDEPYSLLLVTANDVVVCLLKTIILLDANGGRKMEWNMESLILYLKVIGGPPGRESLLVGLMNGEIHIIYVDNSFSTRILTHTAPVRLLDISMSRLHLAVIDENYDLFVYNTTSKEIVMHERNVTGVAFNTEFEQMMCYSGSNMLTMKVAELPVCKQRMQGMVVGLKGSKVFCLRRVAMLTYDVPQSDPLYKFIERKDYESAYRIACLGVTQADWTNLATSALRDLDIEVAKKAFLRNHEIKYMDLIAELEEDKKKGNVIEPVMKAKVLAFLGEYDGAAKLYVDSGDPEKAVDLFASLRDYEKAMQYINMLPNKTLRKTLTMSQAKWCEEIGRWLEAAKVYAVAGMTLKAVTILGERGLVDDLIELARQQKLDQPALQKAGEYFVRFKAHAYAREIFMRLGDMGALIQLHVRLGEWESAINIAEQHPQLLSRVFLPYAAWLAEHGNFDEAQKAFHKAGRPDQAIQLLREMQNDAVAKSQFRVASRYLWMISNEFLSTKDRNDIMKGEYALMLSEMYYSYDVIHQSTYSPVTTHSSDVIFNAGLFLVSTLCSVRFNYLNSATSLSITSPPSSSSAISAYGAGLPFQAGQQGKQNSIQNSSLTPPTVSSGSTYTSSSASTLSSRTPEGISYSISLYSLHRHAWRLGAWRFLRNICRKLSNCKLPQQLTHQVELTSLLVRSKPVNDSPHLQQFCWRCNSVNSLNLDTKDGDGCQFCGHRFIRSYYSFLPLPIIEFFADDGIPQSEVESLLRALPPSQSSASFGSSSPYKSGTKMGRDEDGWSEEINGGDGDSGYQRLSISGSAIGRRGGSSGKGGSSDSSSGGRFGVGVPSGSGTTMGFFKNTQFGSLMYQVQHGNSSLKVSLNRDGLREMPPDSVFIAKYPPPLRWRYFVNLVDSVPVVLCSTCWHFFTEEDFAISIYSSGRCPFCYTSLSNLSPEIQKQYIIKPRTDVNLNPTPKEEATNSKNASKPEKKGNIKSKASITSSQSPKAQGKQYRQMTVSQGVWRMPTLGKKE